MFYEFVLFALIFAMSIVYIDAGHRRCPAMETPKTTSTSTTTKTAPVVSVNPELCNVKYMNPPCTDELCSREDLGVFCCCDNTGNEAKPLKNQSSLCHIEQGAPECIATRVTCSGCDENRRCFCAESKVPG